MNWRAPDWLRSLEYERLNAMSKMKNWMMDVEEFCAGYFYDGEGAMNDFSIEEVSDDAKKFFGSSMAKDYAIVYLTKTLGEI